MFKPQISLFEHLEGYTYLISATLATVLLALSIYAYKKNMLKKYFMRFLHFYFLLVIYFSSHLKIFELLAPASGIDLVAASLTTIVLLFFFLAILKK